ncbi:MAG: Outer membrane protein assembly factor BamD [bacterium]|nr:Outer membrane protein assembly factor BamD [bacterium]
MEMYRNGAGKRRNLTTALTCFLLFAFCRLVFPQNTPANDDFLYAQKLFNDGYYDLSISQLRLFMQRYPDAQQAAEAWRLTGEANFALKKFAASREAFETLEVRYPAHPAIESARLRLAECFAKENDLPSAALTYQRFVLLHPQSNRAPEAQYRGAELWLRAGDVEKARVMLYKLLEDYSSSDYRLPGHLLLVQSFENGGDSQRALDEAERLLRSFPQNDLTPQAYYIRARLQEQLGQFQLAETSYRDLVTRFAPTEDSKKLPAGKARPGVTLSGTNEWTSQAFARLAELSDARGDWNGAISLLDKAENQATNSGAKNALVLRRVEILTEMQDYNRALEALSKFDRSAPDSVHHLIYLYTIGFVQENLKNAANALDAYRQVTLLPRAFESRSDSSRVHPQYRRQRSFWRAAVVSSRQQKYNEALAFCRAYRHEYPDGQFRDRLALLEADIQRDGLNDYPVALRLYQELLEKFPESPLVDDVQWAVADTYEKIGEKRLARAEWQRLLKFYPASEHFAGVQNRLRRLEEFEPNDTPESMAKLTQLILAQSRNANNTFTPNELAVQFAKLHFERREFPQAVSYCKQVLQQQDNSRAWHEALLLLGSCYFQLGEQELLRHQATDNPPQESERWKSAWFDSAKISLNYLAQKADSTETQDLAKRAGVLLARLMFPPMNTIFGSASAVPHLPPMLARADSILALYGDDANLDYLRVWAAQTRKQLQAAALATSSPSRKLLLAEIDSLENSRLISTLQNFAGQDKSPWRNLAQLELADWYWQRGDSANAVRQMAQLQNSPVKDPNSALGQFMLAKWLIQRKNFDLALDQLKTLQKRYFYSALVDSAALLRVRLLMAANRYREALQAMPTGEGGGQKTNRPYTDGEALGQNGSDLDRARVAEAAAAYPVAIRSYLRFLQTHPQAPEAPAVLLHAARLTKQVGAHQLANSYYEECLQRFPESPEAGEAKINLADMRYEAEDYAGARTLYLELVKEAPTLEKAPAAKWEVRSRKGAILCLYKTNQASLAESEIKIFKMRFPDDKMNLAELQYAAGELAVTQKNFPEAEKIFKKVSGDYRNTPSAIYGDYGLGKALIIQNKFDEALDVLTEIPRRYPNHPFLPTFYIGLGDFYQSQQQWDNAITAFSKVVQDSAFDNNYRLATRYLINVYDRLGLYDRAIGLCRHYLAQFPDDEMAFNLRIKIGVFLMNLSQFDDAITHFRALKPFADAETEPEIQYYIGKSYFNAGKFEQAIAELLRVKFFSKPTKLPWDVTALYESGLCYLRLKNYERARQLFQQIVKEQGSESDFGRFAKAKIDELEEMRKQSQ